MQVIARIVTPYLPGGGNDKEGEMGWRGKRVERVEMGTEGEAGKEGGNE
ncbi:hypothetical protein QA596_09110 [Balneolales bacterium ANBcel1]|nr:hypothetical protein [Balneolales bacterium ANBcel1]